MKCDFNKLCLYLNKELDEKAQLEVLNHISKCEICCQAICQVARDKEVDMLVRKRLKTNISGRHVDGRNESLGSREFPNH